MIDKTDKIFVWPKNYPLPKFVMLEVTDLGDNKIQISLVDKKHNDVLDCDTAYIWHNASWIDWTKFHCDQFKNSLKGAGVY